MNHRTDSNYNSNYNKLIIEPFQINFEPGLNLDGDIYRPICFKPLAVVLLRTPYSKSNFNALFDPVVIARMGFAVVIQNVRGRYESDGHFYPFVNEKKDGIITIQWLKEQAWCNGQIMAIGASYEGFAAMACSDKLTAVVSIVSAKDIHNFWFFENGLVRQSFIQAWTHSLAYTDKNFLKSDEISYLQLLANDLPSLYKSDLNDFPVAKYLPYYSSLINFSDDIYWRNINNQTFSGNNITPGYYISGWYDIFCEGTINDYQIACQLVNHSQKLVIGPWSHNDLFSSLVGEIDFGVKNVSAYNPYEIFNWFLEVSRNKVPCSANIFIMGKNKWINLSCWPPITTSTRLFISSKKLIDKSVSIRRLTFSQSINDGNDYFIAKKNEYFPSRGGRTLDTSTSQQGKPGPFDQSSLLKRDDILVYTSDEFTEDFTIVGMVKATLSVVVNYDTSIHIMLIDHMPDGRAINILDTCYPLKKSTSAKKVNIDIGNTAYTFKCGHCIQLVFSSSRFPRLSIHNNLTKYNIKYELFWGPDYSSYIELPEYKENL